MTSQCPGVCISANYWSVTMTTRFPVLGVVLVVASVNLCCSNSPLDRTRLPRDDGQLPSIKDLRLSSCHFDAGVLHVELTWTSPTSSSASTVSRYDIRVAETESQLRTSFTAAPKIEPDLVVHGSLTPSASGTSEKLTTKLPLKAVWPKYVFGLKTFNTNNKPSPISSLVTVVARNCRDVKSTEQTPTRGADHTSPSVSKELRGSQSLGAGPIVGGIIAVLIITAVTVVVMLKLKHKNNKTTPPADPMTAQMTEPSVPPATFDLVI